MDSTNPSSHPIAPTRIRYISISKMVMSRCLPLGDTRAPTCQILAANGVGTTMKAGWHPDTSSSTRILCFMRKPVISLPSMCRTHPTNHSSQSCPRKSRTLQCCPPMNSMAKLKPDREAILSSNLTLWLVVFWIWLKVWK